MRKKHWNREAPLQKSAHRSGHCSDRFWPPTLSVIQVLWGTFSPQSSQVFSPSESSQENDHEKVCPKPSEKALPPKLIMPRFKLFFKILFCMFVCVCASEEASLSFWQGRSPPIKTSRRQLTSRAAWKTHEIIGKFVRKWASLWLPTSILKSFGYHR